MNNKFYIYYFGVIISNIGNALTTFAVPLFILDLTKSTLHLSIVSALQLIPFLIFGLPFGAIIDNVNIKKLMQYSDIARFAIYLIFAYITYFYSGDIVIIAVYITSILSGICYVFHTIAESTLIPYLVANEKLTRANSLIYSIQYVTNFIVPILGGKMYEYDHIGLFFLFDAVTFLLSFLILFVLKIEFKDSKKGNNFILGSTKIISDVKESVIYLKENKFLLKVLVIVAISNIIICPYYNCLIDFLKNSLDLKASIIGVVEGIYSLGALVGALLVDYLVKKINKINIVIFCIGIDALCRLLLPYNSSIIFICVMMIIIELTSSILNIMVITIRQESIEQEYLGRLNSIFKTVLLGVNPIGLLIGGLITIKIGSYNNMILISCLCLILFIVSLTSFKEKK